jgi:hypothetical protein
MEKSEPANELEYQELLRTASQINAKKFERVAKTM